MNNEIVQTPDTKKKFIFRIWIALLSGPVVYTLVPLLAWKGVFSLEETVVFFSQQTVDLVFYVACVVSVSMCIFVFFGERLVHIFMPHNNKTNTLSLFFLKAGFAEMIGILGLLYALLTGDGARALPFGLVSILVFGLLYPRL